LFTSFCTFPQSLNLLSGHPLLTDFGQARPTSPAPQQQIPHSCGMFAKISLEPSVLEMYFESESTWKLQSKQIF